jgi:23S rRNA (adenine2030-N6)-methyltransferase
MVRAMLSYQHAYHAGGPADLHKHAAVAGLLALLKAKKSRAISYLESHAGRALYDIVAPEALKTGEALRGVASLEPAEHPFWEAVGATRAAHGATAYPGSPLIARHLLGAEDRIALMELHPAEHAALKAAMAGEGVAIHRRDGAEGLRALTPPSPRRGLALIDPSYEVKAEYLDTAMLALELSTRWPEGVVVVWYPLLRDARHAALIGPVEAVAPEGMIRDEALFADPPERGMIGSGLLILNPPYGAEAALAEARAAVADAFDETRPAARVA